MRAIAQLATSVGPHSPLTYVEIGGRVCGPTRGLDELAAPLRVPSEAQLKSIGRACRRLAEKRQLEEWWGAGQGLYGRPAKTRPVEPSWRLVAAVSRPLPGAELQRLWRKIRESALENDALALDAIESQLEAVIDGLRSSSGLARQLELHGRIDDLLGSDPWYQDLIYWPPRGHFWQRLDVARKLENVRARRSGSF
jgi:hypothetical protein